METAIRKNADDILRRYREMPETYESVEAARARRARDLLRRVLVEHDLQDELIGEWDDRRRGLRRSSHPQWALNLAYGLVKENCGKRRTIAAYGRKLHAEAIGGGEKPLATILAYEIEVQYLSDVARELLRA